MILGIDEVGRGSWAGPLVVGAVVLQADTQIDGLTDSKKLTKRKRETLEPIIIARAAAYGLGWVHAEELDQIGMAAALRLATIRAVEQIHSPYQEIIIDGTINFLAHTKKGQYVTTMVKADLLIPSVSAASVLAKVARDRFMAGQAVNYAAYDFAQNVGYGTALHRQAIAKYGVTPLHRLSFKPLVQYQPPIPIPSPKNIGQLAEDIAAAFLLARGYEILERNWRTKFCEIDVICRKDQGLYIIEVKHRRGTQQGGGVAAIDAKKLQKLQLGAEAYVGHHPSYQTFELRRALITTSGDGDIPRVESFIQID